MKKFNNKIKDNAYTVWRLISPICDPIKFLTGFTGYWWFVRDFIEYKNKDPKSKLSIKDIFPQLHDKTSYTSLDAHYFYQQLWTFEKILTEKPKRHTDVGSTFQMSGYVSKITNVEFVDIRPVETSLKNFKSVRGDITQLPYKDGELESVSCLHVVEHVGLGRYGDKLDPKGSEKAILELQRVLAKSGTLYFSVPIGIPKTCFNAHRIFDPEDIVRFFRDLKLTEFSMVNDAGKFIQNADMATAKVQNYACGIFCFKKR
jgi:hypothetical protein